MQLFKNIFAFTILAVFIFSCTDPIDINLKEGEKEIAVDGSIVDQSKNNLPIRSDTIRITYTNGFSNGPSPVVSNAVVVLKDNIGSVDTLDYTSNGKYITHPEKIKGVVGRIYELTIDVDGENYKAVDYLKRTTNIDSLVSEYRKLPEFGRAPGYFVNLIAKDVEGPGDLYRFKVYKNGILYNRPSDLTIAADAGFGLNNPIDNLRFIFPIRESLNPVTDVPDTETSGDKAPYIPGDEVKVEIYSISEPTYLFYNELFRQISNDGLFASPASNVHTNIFNTNPKSAKKAVGWFSASAVVSKTIVIKAK